jgi:hypothetical protein
MMNLEPKPARLEDPRRAARGSYGTGEAIEAYIRACQAHGWQIPKDFSDFGVANSAESAPRGFGEAARGVNEKMN